MGDFLKKAYDDAERAKASIWHTPEQIPNPDERILFESKTHGMQFGSYCPVEHYCSRDEFIDPVEPEDVIRWLYIKDIDEWIKFANMAKEHIDGLNSMIESWNSLLLADHDDATKLRILKTAISTYTNERKKQ